MNFATADGSATAPGDYDSTSGPLSFTPGQTSKTIAIPIAGDTVVEPDETFAVNLSGPGNATLADAQRRRQQQLLHAITGQKVLAHRSPHHSGNDQIVTVNSDEKAAPSRGTFL